MGGLTSLFEPEELFGEYWHRLVGDIGREHQHADARVKFEDVQKKLGIFFRGLGGDSGIAIKSIARQTVDYRQNLATRMSNGSNAVSRSKFDGDFLYLPQSIEILPEKILNAEIYRWLTAWNACIGKNFPQTNNDPLQNDIQYIRYAHALSQFVIAEFKGLRSSYERLVPALSATRPKRVLPSQEAAVEFAIHALLQNNLACELEGEQREIFDAILDPNKPIGQLQSNAKYKTFLPLIIWGDVEFIKREKRAVRQEREHSTEPSAETHDEQTKKAKRRKSDQIEKKDSLILHRFESILSWSEMMNIPRAVDDEEEENAKRAANDQDELGLTNLARKAATKLKFDLDLAPEDVDIERLSDVHTYPEWDYRINAYHKDHCRILASLSPANADIVWQPDKGARRRIRAVKRQFEALRPRRENVYNQIDGHDIDFNALIRSHCDMAANGEGSNRVFINSKEETRDLSVSILIDVSRSCESWIEGRQIIDISKEALMALTLGLEACGDANAIYSFSSLKRDRVFISNLKQFNEPLGPKVFSRIGALKPGHYTRLGAAIRHVNQELTATSSTRKLLLILSDGKPNDLDHYEGRYGIEDSAMAVREVRRSGNAVFGITIDKNAQSYFPHIFGRNAFAITSDANDLVKALPQIYRHLVT